jgi:hypothetical protein
VIRNRVAVVEIVKEPAVDADSPEFLLDARDVRHANLLRSPAVADEG